MSPSSNPLHASKRGSFEILWIFLGDRQLQEFRRIHLSHKSLSELEWSENLQSMKVGELSSELFSEMGEKSDIVICWAEETAQKQENSGYSFRFAISAHSQTL